MDERRIKVAMVGPQDLQCGISDYTRHLIQAICLDENVYCTLVFSPPNSASANGHIDALRSFRTRDKRYQDAGKLVSASEPDVVHVQHEYSLFGGVAPHKNHAGSFYDSILQPIVLTVHEIANASSGVANLYIAMGNKANFLHPNIKHWIVHTRKDRQNLIEIGVNAQLITEIPVPSPDPLALPDREAAACRLDLLGKRVITLFGFISNKKGHVDAIRAVELLPDDMALLIAGGKHPADKSAYVSDLRQEILKSPARDRIRITGFLEQDELLDVLAVTDTAIAPYLSSSGSASLMHLMAYGLPIVSTDIPAFAEIESQHPGSLSLISPRAPIELATRILEIASNLPLNQQLMSNSRRAAQANSYTSAATRTVEVYTQALNR